MRKTVLTDCQNRRKQLVQLFLDGEQGPLIDRLTFEESGYRIKGEISPQQLDDLKALSEYNRAKSKALFLLGLRDYGSVEMERKLAAEYPGEVCARVVERLTELGLLDDEAYARRLCRHLQEYKGYPKRRIQQELLRRGLPRDTVEEALEETPDTDLQQALDLLQKKYYNKVSDRPSREKTMAALARRGFSYATVRRAVEVFTNTRQEDEESEEWQ